MGGAQRSGLNGPKRYGVIFSLARLDTQRASYWEGDGDGELTGGGGDRRRGCRAAPEVLLGRLLQVQRRGQLRSAGNGRWSTGTSRSASSTESTGAREMLSRRFLVMVWFFSAKNGGLL
jgi:hypothetical protein